MRATLNDELMREAGFETDYYRELERRRQERRQATRRAAVRAGGLVLGAAAVVELWGRFLPGVPRVIVAMAFALGVLVPIVSFLRRGYWDDFWSRDAF